jgi:hypothetical protein
MKVAMTPLFELTGSMSRKIYSFEDAVRGDPNDPYVKSIPRSTSSGYPYTFGKDTKKTQFFGTNQDFDFTSEAAQKLKQKVSTVVSDAAQGIRHLHVFSPALKDELRKDAKVAEGKTRLISGAPIDYLIAFRMYFMSFMSACMRTKVATGLCVGVNPHSKDWDMLARRALMKGGKVVAGDYKGFDANGHPQIFSAMITYINQWYNDGPENARIREVLWLELVNSRHVKAYGDKSGQTIYQWMSSLPSGHPFTALGNSIANICLLVLAYNDATGEMYAFWHYIHPFVFGDDNLIAIADALIHVYNQNTLPQLLLPYGFVYTDENKAGDEAAPYRSLTEVSFLKRGFRYDETLTMWVAPLERVSMLKSLYWCSNARLSDSIELSAVDLFIAERAVHGPEGFSEDVQKVISRLNNARSNDRLHTPPFDTEYCTALLRSRDIEL